MSTFLSFATWGGVVYTKILLEIAKSVKVDDENFNFILLCALHDTYLLGLHSNEAYFHKDTYVSDKSTRCGFCSACGAVT